MNNLTLTTGYIPATSEKALAKVKTLETEVLKLPQLELCHYHILHGGMYARTIRLAAGSVMTGKLIKVATLLIISGDVRVSTEDGYTDFIGYNILAGSANRQGAFAAITDCDMTMIFPTKAKTIKEAEEEFTDEAHLLVSRRDGAYNPTMITGE